MLDPEDKGSGPPRRTPESRKEQEITPEQVKAYKDCMSGLFLKAGLPYATIAHIISLWKAKPEVQQQQPTPPQGLPIKRAFFFFANMLIGTFLFAPLCYKALVDQHNLEKKKREELPVAPVTEKAQSTRLPDDYNYPTDLSSYLNEAESTFTDYSPSRILANEDEVTKLTPSTTYQDLRNRHRSSFGRRQEPPPPAPEEPRRSPFGSPDEKPVDNEPSFGNREPRKFVKRNKYGDEIE